MSENPDTNNKSRIAIRFADFAVAAALIGLGYSVGQGQANKNIAFLESEKSSLIEERHELKEKNSTLVSKNQSLSSELSSVKNELFLAKNTTEDKKTNSNINASEVIATTAPDEYSGTETESAILTIRRSNSKEAFDGAITISLAGTEYEGSPLRHTVYGSIGAPAKENLKLEGVDPGYSVIYAGYQVRVIATDTFDATFKVTEVKEPNKSSNSGGDKPVAGS